MKTCRGVIASVSSVWPQQLQQLQQSSLVLIHLSDRSSYNISEPCWYSVSTSLRIEEKLNTDQADWPLIEGMSLWLCGMKCDWLKGGNHSLGRQSCTTECHFTWLIFFLDLHAFKVNWFLIHACACTTQEHRSPISSLMSAPTLTFALLWNLLVRRWQELSLPQAPHTTHYIMSPSISGITIKVNVPGLLVDAVTMYMNLEGNGLCWNGMMVRHRPPIVCFTDTSCYIWYSTLK